MRCPHCGESIIVTWNPKFTRGDENDDELDDDDGAWQDRHDDDAHKTWTE